MKGEMILSFLVSVYLHLINEEQPTRLSASTVSCYTQVDLLLYIKNVINCIIWRDIKKNTKKEFVSQSLRNIKLTEINGHRFFFGHKIKIIHCMIKTHFKSPVVKRLYIVQQYKLSAEIIQRKVFIITCRILTPLLSSKC